VPPVYTATNVLTTVGCYVSGAVAITATALAALAALALPKRLIAAGIFRLLKRPDLVPNLYLSSFFRVMMTSLKVAGVAGVIFLACWGLTLLTDQDRF
jgi:chromate transport protein ChrA